MTTTLVIVESPAKCKKIEEYLGAGYKCMASFGHIRELDGLGSIDFENNYTPHFKTMDSKEQQISKLKRAIREADDVMLATDDDREGEAIAWHLCDQFKLNIRTTKRILFHEITQSALQRAVSNPTNLNMDLVHAQQARQILDLIVGFKISPVLWRAFSQADAKSKSKSKTSLSAGRCQTPALRLVYDNQLEIESNPGKKVYNTTGYFTSQMLPYALDYDYEGEDKMVEFLEESANHDHIITINDPKSTVKNPPTPFTTSSIQQAANNEFRLSPKETMTICQKLYEGGYITYMRTDSTTYSAEFIDLAKSYITTKYGEEFIHENVARLSLRSGEADASVSEEENSKPKKKKAASKKKEEKKVQAQEAHEAIRPTNVECEAIPDDMDPKEKKLYKLIWSNTVESCMSPARYQNLSSTITAPSDKLYKYSTEQVVFLGWKIVQGEDLENPIFAFLQTLKAATISNGTIDYKKITCKVSLKDTKSHYTEAKLVQLLEQRGIGRPSTFSALIEKIQERGYVKKDNVKGKKLACTDFELVDAEITETITEREFGNEKNKLVLQPLGRQVLEFLLEKYNSLFEYEYTKYMEDVLDHIAKGEKEWYELCRECDDQIKTLTGAAGLNSEEVGSRERAGAEDGDGSDNSGEAEAEAKAKQEKKSACIRIDATHKYIIGKNGPVIMIKKGDKVSFKPVKPDLDLEKLKNGKYKLKDIIDEDSKPKLNPLSGRNLGEYEGHPLMLKNGKFGLYVMWGEKTKNLNGIGKSEDDITFNDVKAFIESAPVASSSMVRTLNDNLSIRNSKHGDYIYYKTARMKSPKFFKLNDYNGDYKTDPVTKVLGWISFIHEIKC